jgi:hypothetical protein
VSQGSELASSSDTKSEFLDPDIHPGVSVKTRIHLLLFLCAFVPPAAPSLCSEATSPPLGHDEALRVYIDCQSRFCDLNHFRREITFVNYVRERRDAQVHVLVTTQKTGGGGEEFAIAFIGQEKFDTLNDSLYYFSSSTDTYDEIRAGITHRLKLGLVRYASKLSSAEHLDVAFQPPDTLPPTRSEAEDPWDYWIYRVRVGGDISGEKRQRFINGNGSLSANRTTEDWKVRLYLQGGFSEDVFELSDGSTFRSVFREYGGGAFVVKSVDEHRSLGGLAKFEVSTFQNHDLALEIGPAAEYNLFPYSESTRRELTFSYAIRLKYFNYEELTIFDKTSEVRLGQSLEVSYSVQQPFGTINTSLEASSFLFDIGQHRVELSSWLEIRLFRGLQLDISGGVERTKDQINLPRGGATDEEVLLRRQELGTDYRYYIDVGISYTFGSIYNNVVNPRFD